METEGLGLPPQPSCARSDQAGRLGLRPVGAYARRERKNRHLQSLTSYIRQYSPEPRTPLCSGHLLGQDGTKSSFKFFPLQGLVVAYFSGLDPVFFGGNS
jgi:hypothetical protein